METVAVAASEHHTSGKFIDDDDFAVADNVVNVTFHHVAGFQSLENVVVDFHVFRIGEVLDFKESFALGNAAVGQRNLVIFFIDNEVAGFRLGFFILVPLRQGGYEAVRSAVHVRGLIAFAGNDQRRSRFINEDGVNFVDDGVVEFALHHFFFVGDHVVTQIVETVFVVGSVCNVRQISLAAFFFLNAVDNAANCQPQESVQFAHPLHVTLSQVIIDGDDVNAFAFQRIQISRQRSHQSLTFTSLHLGNTSLMEYDAADDLYTEVFHAQGSLCTFTAYRKSFRQKIVQCFPCCNTVFELLCFSPQLLIGKLLHFLIKSHNLVCNFFDFLNFFLIEIAENLFH